MEYKFQLAVGDWSDDGHGKCDKFIIISNKDKAAVQIAYEKAIEKFGFSLHELCCEYEESCIMEHEWSKLIER